MAGDKIDILGKSYFLNTATVNNANSTPLDLAALMASMLLSPANAAAGKGISAGTLTSINTGILPGTFFRGSNGETTTIPKAYINYIFFDEQFKYAGGNASRVGSSGVVKDHWYADAAALQNITVPKNGYIFVYVSNESNLDVFFDNLQVIHTPGPILEETHYYPFGLTQAGISSKSFQSSSPDCGCPGNKKGFNGNEIQNKEFSDGSGLEIYDFNARTYDQQIGRFIQIDPLPSDGDQESLTPYQFGLNNPIRYNDPDGKCPICPALPWIAEGVKWVAVGVASYFTAKAAAPIIQKGAENAGKALSEAPPSNIVMGSPLMMGTSSYSPSKDEGIVYKVPGEKTPSGKPYIGSSDNLNKREKNANDGRDRKDAEVVGTYPKGDTKARKATEQKAIDKEFKEQDGKPGQKLKEVLDNKRNEVAEKNRKKYGLD